MNNTVPRASRRTRSISNQTAYISAHIYLDTCGCCSGFHLIYARHPRAIYCSMIIAAIRHLPPPSCAPRRRTGYPILHRETHRTPARTFKPPPGPTKSVPLTRIIRGPKPSFARFLDIPLTHRYHSHSRTKILPCSL